MQRTPFATFTGKPIVFADPKQTVVCEDDLIFALRRLIRYGGHVDVTVLRHLALCAELGAFHGFTGRWLAYIAAHDLHEAYVLEVPKGLKEYLGDVYADLETAWENHVHESIGLDLTVRTPSEAKSVHFVDWRALIVEMARYNYTTLDAAVKASPPGWVTSRALPMTEEMAIGRKILSSTDHKWHWSIVRNAVVNGGGHF